jgi:ABC-2 type transport system permease protein
MSFAALWKRNQAFFKLGLQQNLEYRFNYFMDAVGQPVLSAGIETLLWFAVFRSLPGDTLGGFTLDAYLAYALAASFVSRVCSNWMYEFRMIEEIESGTLNSLLVRPLHFYEYYLSQFMGYKLLTATASWWVPISVISYFRLPFIWDHLPRVLLTMSVYLVLLHTISFLVATLSFHLTKVGSFTVAKNLLFWVLSGELIPLDLIPEPYRHWLLALPFCNAVYIPVGYLTGRVSDELWFSGLISTVVAIGFFGGLAAFAWKRGVERYVGTGA